MIINDILLFKLYLYAVYFNTKNLQLVDVSQLSLVGHTLLETAHISPKEKLKKLPLILSKNTVLIL